MLSSKLWLFCYQVLDEIDEHGIKIYSFPDCDSEDDEEFVEINQELKVEFQYFLYRKVQQIEITIPERSEELILDWNDALSQEMTHKKHFICVSHACGFRHKTNNFAQYRIYLCLN